MATKWVTIPRSPTMREIDDGWVLADEPATSSSMSPVAVPPPGAPAAVAVDVNAATLEELTALQGIGPTLARRIIEARPFASLDDLAAVPRLGGKTLSRLRAMLRV